MQLVEQMADLAGIRAGQTALDAGCGPGAPSAKLVARLVIDRVCAVDPSAPFSGHRRGLRERCR